jgi:hypothetical protein
LPQCRDDGHPSPTNAHWRQWTTRATITEPLPAIPPLTDIISSDTPTLETVNDRHCHHEADHGHHTAGTAEYTHTTDHTYRQHTATECRAALSSDSPSHTTSSQAQCMCITVAVCHYRRSVLQSISSHCYSLHLLSLCPPSHPTALIMIYFAICANCVWQVLFALQTVLLFGARLLSLLAYLDEPSEGCGETYCAPTAPGSGRDRRATRPTTRLCSVPLLIRLGRHRRTI